MSGSFDNLGVNKTFFSLIVVLFLVIGTIFVPSVQDTIYELSVDLGFEEEVGLVKESFDTDVVINTLDYDVYMCPSENTSCEEFFIEYLSLTKNSLKCALYELDSFEIVGELNRLLENGVEISIVVDDNYLEEDALQEISSGITLLSDTNRNTRYNNYMHHKFCVRDETSVLVSSANPTENGLFFNNNNILEFNSKEISGVYLEEFSKLASGSFGYHKTLTIAPTSFEVVNSSIDSLDFYMCPQDGCENAIVDILEGANESIYFANFVLTLNSVESELLQKSNQGVNVEGVIESRMWNTRGSIAQNLSNKFNVVKDSNPKTMHHKFFVVDEYYVITGSMNPSNSGVNYNDENMMVIGSAEVAELFIDEFKSLQ